MRAPLLLLPLLALAAVGCGVGTCGQTCDKLYGDVDGQCGIQRPGASQAELVARCMDECRDAMGTLGELGDYDPWEQRGSSAAVVLQNRDQAREWTACVEQTSCEELTQGYCAPIW